MLLVPGSSWMRQAGGRQSLPEVDPPATSQDSPLRDTRHASQCPWLGVSSDSKERVQHKRDQDYLEGSLRGKRTLLAAKTGTLQSGFTVLLSKQDTYEAETAKSVGSEIPDLRPDFDSQTEPTPAVWREVNCTTSLRPASLFIN